MARPRMYPVLLSEDERASLRRMIGAGIHRSRELNRARILLFIDEDRTDSEIVSALGVCSATIYNVCRRFQSGRLGTLKDAPRTGPPKKLTGAVSARITAIASTQPPEGYASWTMQMIADRAIAMEILPSISDESVRTMVKKTNSSHT